MRLTWRGQHKVSKITKAELNEPQMLPNMSPAIPNQSAQNSLSTTSLTCSSVCKHTLCKCLTYTDSTQTIQQASRQTDNSDQRPQITDNRERAREKRKERQRERERERERESEGGREERSEGSKGGSGRDWDGQIRKRRNGVCLGIENITIVAT